MMKNTVRSFLVSLTMFAGHALAQAKSQQEIEDAVQLMRRSGASEDQIQQFIDVMEQLNAMQQEEPAQVETHPDVNADTVADEVVAAPVSNADNALPSVTGLTTLLGALGGQSKAQVLNGEIAEFIRLHGHKNDVQVTVGTEIFKLKLLRCDYQGETFIIEAEGVPQEAGKRGPNLTIGRSGPYAGGDSGQGYYLEYSSFNTPELNVSSDAIDDTFDGGQFAFEGQTEITTENGQLRPYSINLSCQ